MGETDEYERSHCEIKKWISRHQDEKSLRVGSEPCVILTDK